MVEDRHYANAPITEAIIDLRARLPESVTAQDLARAIRGSETAYPTRRERRKANWEITVGDNLGSSVSSALLGYAFTSGDGKQVFQARMDGFTMSRLWPYESWEPFRCEARRLWDVYRAVASPQAVTRIAVRYINRLDLPLPLDDFADYLRTSVEVSPDLPQGVAGFFVRVNIPQEDIKSALLLNEAIVEPARAGVVSVVLDIDLYRDAEIPSAEDDVWDLFEALHDRKNAIFEACITEKTRELIS